MYRIIIAPVLGGIIGYITNDLAIKMLFRPRKSIYIGKFHIPFTPGLIPQQKLRIAKSIGQMISSQLLDAETIKRTMLSDGTVLKMKEKLCAFFASFSDDTRTVREFAENYMDEETIDGRLECIRKKAASAISNRIVQADAGRILVDAGWESLTEKIGTKRLFAVFFTDDGVAESIKEPLERKVNELVAEKAPGIIENELDKVFTETLNMRICDLYARYRDREEETVEYIIHLLRMTLEQNMEKLLDAVGIEQIVVGKINSFDAQELESMIFGIMKRELKAIVYLGAALGFCMGFINLLF